MYLTEIQHFFFLQKEKEGEQGLNLKMDSDRIHIAM